MRIERIDSSLRYSQAVVHGETVYVAGQIANTRDGDITLQTREVLARIDEVLAQAGASKSRLLFMQVWLSSFDDYAAFNAAYDAWIDTSAKPARATVRADLLDARLKVEVSVVAARRVEEYIKKLTIEKILAQTTATIEQVDTETAQRLVGSAGYLFVDVRDREELATGIIPGALHASRGNLEFYLDTQCAAHLPALSAARRLIFVCGSGGRAALATKLARDFGYEAVCLTGGMKAWRAAGAPIVDHAA